jgi:hypothetical protein
VQTQPVAIPSDLEIRYNAPSSITTHFRTDATQAFFFVVSASLRSLP